MTASLRLDLTRRLRRAWVFLRRRSAGVRIRLALTYTLAAFLLAVAGGALFTAALRHGLRTNVDSDLATRADQTASALTTSSRPGGTDPFLAGVTGDDVRDVTVVLRPDGTRAAPASLSVAIPLPADAAARARSGPVHLGAERDGRRYRFLAEPIARPDGTWTVLVGTDLSLAEDVADDTAHYLLVVAPLLLVAVGVFAWLLSGSALRPVERMRADAARVARHLELSPGRPPAADGPAADGPAADGPAVSVPATGDEVQALAETFNELLARLHHSLEQQRDLVADAGHELRTPLATLSMELELAARPGRDLAGLQEAVRHAAGEVDRLIRLANSLLWLAGPPTARRAPASLRSVVEQSLRARRAQAAAGGVRLYLEPGAATVTEVDELAVRQAVDNLLANALAVAPPGSTIRTHVSQTAEQAVLLVDDDGPGIATDLLPHAFDRFRRGGQDRSGAGLGLAVVASVAAAHGGWAELGNRPDGGARACLVLARRATPLPATGDGIGLS